MIRISNERRLDLDGRMAGLSAGSRATVRLSPPYSTGMSSPPAPASPLHAVAAARFPRASVRGLTTIAPRGIQIFLDLLEETPASWWRSTRRRSRAPK
jgi:hypothetical protein